MKETIISLEEFRSLSDSFPRPCLYRGQNNALNGLVCGIGRQHPQYVPTPELEKALFQQFKSRAHPHLTAPEQKSDWELLVTAQHYGLKTRLLDWTSNWRVALYFAALPHDEMRRVPISIFVCNQPILTSYTDLPANPFDCDKDYYFQPPYLNNRIAGQAAYLSVHRDPHSPLTGDNISQFSFLPFSDHRRAIAKFLAESSITAAEMTPGLDGICRSLVNEPRIAAQIELARPEPESEGDWRSVPPSAVGKTVGMIRREICTSRKLALVLEFMDVEGLIGIPCYCDGKLFGLLKYANRAQTRFIFLTPDGNSTETIRSVDEEFARLQLSKRNIESLFPEDPTFRRRVKT